MDEKKKIIRKIFVFFVSFFMFLGCETNINYPPISPNANVRFLNKTDLVVNVYTDPEMTMLLSEINAKSWYSCFATVIPTGNVFYYKYLLKIGNVLIPYGEGRCQVKVEEKTLASIDILLPTEIYTNSNVVLLENKSNSAISISVNNNSSSLPLEKTLLNKNEYGIFLLKNEIFSINDKPFNIISENKGYICSYLYTGSIDDEIVLCSKTPLDLSAKDKVWKIALSTQNGKYLSVGDICSRENSEAGYMLFGGMSYSRYSDKNKPYYAMIDSKGNVSGERSFYFRNDTFNNTIFTDAIEKNGICLAIGKNIYDDKTDSLFVMSDFNGYSIYEEIPSTYSEGDVFPDAIQQNRESDCCVYKSYGLIHVEDNSFCVLLGYEDNLPGFELHKLIVEDEDSIKTELIYKSNEDVIPQSVAYANGKYIVLSQSLVESSEFKSFVSIIEGGNVHEETIEIENYLFNKLKINQSDSLVYLSGSYVSTIDFRDSAAFGTIDLNSKNFTKLWKSEEVSNSNSNFYDFSFIDNDVVLCGFSDAVYKQGENPLSSSSAVPYLLSYSLTDKKTNWDRKYEDYKGYVVYAVNKSSINSLFLELYNKTECSSYLVSTGLLGEIPEDTKITLPCSPSIDAVEESQVSVYFYENQNSIMHYNQATFVLGKEYTLEDFEKYAPAEIPNGHDVVGWRIFSPNPEKQSSRMVVKPSGVPTDPDREEDPSTDNVKKELEFPKIFTNTNDLHVYPIISLEHTSLENWSYDDSYHWYECLCGEKLTDKEEHRFGKWQITIKPEKNIDGERQKSCSVCGFKIIEKIDSVFDKQILQDSGKKEIIDNGEWGLGTANSNKGNVLDLSKYAKYMTEDFYFVFDVVLDFEAYWSLFDFNDFDGYEEGYKQIFLYYRDPGVIGDSIGIFDASTIRTQKGLLCEEEWTDDKGVKRFSWKIDGDYCSDKMCIRYDAWGNLEDTWYLKSLSVALSIKPKE